MSRPRGDIHDGRNATREKNPAPNCRLAVCSAWRKSGSAAARDRLMVFMGAQSTLAGVQPLRYDFQATVGETACQPDLIEIGGLTGPHDPRKSGHGCRITPQPPGVDTASVKSCQCCIVVVKPGFYHKSSPARYAIHLTAVGAVKVKLWHTPQLVKSQVLRLGLSSPRLLRMWC